MKGQNISQMPSITFTLDQKHSTIIFILFFLKKKKEELEIENQVNAIPQPTSSQTTMSRYRTDSKNENTFSKHHTCPKL
jgi:hypothetical protein